jgi:hypothetical protein
MLRIMGWAGQVACMIEMKNAYKFWSENLKGKSYSEDLVMGGRIILECILMKSFGKLWTR